MALNSKFIRRELNSYVSNFASAYEQNDGERIKSFRGSLSEYIVRELGVPKREANRYHDRANLQMDIKELEVDLRRLIPKHEPKEMVVDQDSMLEDDDEAVSPTNQKHLYEKCTKLAMKYLELANNFVSGDTINVDTIRESAQWRLEAILHIDNAHVVVAPTLENLKTLAAEYVELSRYFDYAELAEPRKKQRYMLSAITILVQALAALDRKQTKEKAELCLLISDHYYQLALIARDQEKRPDKARDFLHKSRQYRIAVDRVKRQSEVREELREIEKMVERSERRRPPVRDEVFMQHQRDDKFFVKLCAALKRFNPDKFLIALFNMHSEASRAEENKSMEDAICKFENYFAEMVHKFNNDQLQSFYDLFHHDELINLSNGLLFYSTRYYDLGENYDSVAIEEGRAYCAGKTSTMLKKMHNILDVCMRMRGLELRPNGFINDASTIPVDKVIHLNARNKDAFTRLFDRVRKGKLSLMPVSNKFYASYSMIERSLSYYLHAMFSPKHFVAGFMSLKQELALANPGNDEAELTASVKAFLNKKLRQSSTDELLTLYNNFSGKCVNNFMQMLYQLREGEKVQGMEKIDLERVNTTYEFASYMAENIRTELNRRGMKYDAYFFQQAIEAAQQTRAYFRNRLTAKKYLCEGDIAAPLPMI